MKTIIKFLKRACNVCHGMGVIEVSNGGTKTCPACKGKGMI